MGKPTLVSIKWRVIRQCPNCSRVVSFTFEDGNYTCNTCGLRFTIRIHEKEE